MMKRRVTINKSSEFADDNMIHGKSYAFFHRPKYPALPPRWYMTLVELARRSVDIWDPYFNYNQNDVASDCRIFNHLRNSLKFRYMLVKEKADFDKKVQTWEPEISNAIPKAVKNGTEVTLACISTSDDLGKKWEFHDRFLIIDGERVFLIGGSLGYHLSSIASTGIFELMDEEDKNLVKDMFELYWTFAKTRNHYKEIAL
jgi:hypothetical protein